MRRAGRTLQVGSPTGRQDAILAGGQEEQPWPALGGTTWYEQAAAGAKPRAALTGGIETETCVIGGGLAGLGTALSLAERGQAVVLLEGGRIGGGASGRNGGMASAGFNRDFALPADERRPGRLPRPFTG